MRITQPLPCTTVQPVTATSPILHPYPGIPFTFTQHVSINFAATSAEKGYSVLASRISFRANKKPGPCLKPSLSCVWAGPDVTTHQHH
jgi:hypothetical protein